MKSSPSRMLPVSIAKGRIHDELCITFCGIWLRSNITSTQILSASKQKHAKASQMAMSNFKWVGKCNLLMSLERGDSEILARYCKEC